MTRLAAVVRRLWPAALIILASLVLQDVLLQSRYDVDGHAAEHLMSAEAPFLAAAVVLIILWATPSGRRQPDVVLGCAAWLAATVLVLVGNVRVVDELIDNGTGKAPTEGLPDVADHGLADLAPWPALLAALFVVAVMWRRRHVSPRVALGAAIVSVICPPWIIPGAGMVVLAIARCVARAKAVDDVQVSGDVLR